MKKQFVAFTLIIGVSLLGGCEPLTEEEELLVEEHSLEINGNFTTSGCSKARSQKISDAIDFITSRASTTGFRECIKSAHLTEMHGEMVEDVRIMLLSPSTQASCVAPGHCGGSAAACAPVNPYPSNSWPETMSIETDYLDSASITELAGTIVHEAVHTRGFNHPGSTSFPRYPFTAPPQFGTCIKDYQEDGWGRNQPMGDTILSPVGNDSGQPFLYSCPPGQEVIGISVSSSSTKVNRMRLYCSGGASSPWIGEYGNSIQTKTLSCPSNSSLHRISHRADSSAVNWMYAYCASNSSLENDWHSYTDQKSLGGTTNTQHTYAFRKCPDGMAVTGATGRKGARIDELRWICEDIDGDRLPNSRKFRTVKGTITGNAKVELCSGNGVMHMLWGHAGGEVDQIGGECLPTTRNAQGNPVVMTGNDKQHSFDYNGGIGGQTFQRMCPSGDAMVGLRVRSGSRINAVSAICADPVTWASGSSTTQYLSFNGGSGGSYSVNKCPSGEFLVGLKSWAKYTPQHSTTTVHGVQLICRDLGS